jgi:hypothetical protein
MKTPDCVKTPLMAAFGRLARTAEKGGANPAIMRQRNSTNGESSPRYAQHSALRKVGR